MIVPLRKHHANGNRYVRPPEIETALTSLDELPIDEVVRRAFINDVKDSEYVPSECLLHFVRKSKENGDSQPYWDLFAALRRRVLQAVPVRPHKVAGAARTGEDDVEKQIQEEVLDSFQKLLCIDRQQYDERLDYYETRFNSAIAKDRASARRKIGGKSKRRKTLVTDAEAAERTRDTELILARLTDEIGEENGEPDYRSRVLGAISHLPPDERQVIELILQGFPLDSKDANVQSIRKILGCSEKTVRNRRDRAVAALQPIFQAEDGE